MASVNQRLFGRTVIDSLELSQNAWWIDSTKITVTGTQLNQLATTKFVTASTLGADVAGSGIGGGSGSALTLALSEVSTGTIDLPTDSLIFLDATDSSNKRQAIMDIASAQAGNGLFAASGVFSQGSYGLIGIGLIGFLATADCTAIVVGAVTYTHSETPGANNGEWAYGASATESATNFAKAVTDDTRNTGSTSYYYAVRDGDYVYLIGKAVGTANATISRTGGASPASLQNVAGGMSKGATSSAILEHTVTAIEAAATVLEIPLPFTANHFIAQIRGSSGAIKVVDDLHVLNTSPARLTITQAGGDTYASGDIITVYISE